MNIFFARNTSHTNEKGARRPAGAKLLRRAAGIRAHGWSYRALCAWYNEMPGKTLLGKVRSDHHQETCPDVTPACRGTDCNKCLGTGYVK